MRTPGEEEAGPGLSLWLALFACSGVGGLIFQVIWTRKLALVLGSTIQSASLTSAAFMFGLGLGALFGARLSRSAVSPLKLFALLELTVACVGLATTAAIPSLPTALQAWLDPQGPSFRFLLVVVSAVLLVLPALCMGATLPLLVAGHLRSGTGFVQVLSVFYAANTLGAAAGAFATDFILVKQFGVWQTACLAAGCDLLAAGVAFWVASGRRSAAGPAIPPPSTPPDRNRGRLPLVLLAVSGFCGLGLEIAWTRLLVFFNGTDIYAYSLVLSVYLFGIVVGSLFVTWLPKRWDNPRTLAILYLLLGLLAWQCVYSLEGMGRLIGLLLDSEHRMGRRLLACFLLILPSTVILGALFPLTSSMLHRARGGDAGGTVGSAYIFSTLGSVLGALVAGFVLLTGFGLQATIQAFGSVALVAAVLAWGAAWPAKRLAGVGVASGLLLLGVWAKAPNALIPLIYDRNGDRLISIVDDHYGAVALVEQLDRAEARRYKNLVVDGYNMAANNLAAQRYTAQLALLPALLDEHPRDVLVICLGLGNTLRALESLPGVERIDVVELSEAVAAMVGQLPDVARALTSPKVSLHVGDGRYFLSTTRRRYDVITAEPPPPTQAGIVNLYSREYYELCKSRLRPDGVVAQWLPVMQMSQFEAKTVIRAFQDVFPYAYLYQGQRLQLVLVGSSRPLAPDLDRVELSLPADRSRLAAVDLDSAGKIFSTFLAGPERLRRYTRDTPPLTDDRPYLQYHNGDWRPDLSFLMEGLREPVERLQGAPVRRVEFEKARQKAVWYAQYTFETSGDPMLDQLLSLARLDQLVRLGVSDFERAITGLTPEHGAQLAAEPPSWNREIALARWSLLQGDTESFELRLEAASKMASGAGEALLVDLLRLQARRVMSAAGRERVVESLQAGRLSPRLRDHVSRLFHEAGE